MSSASVLAVQELRRFFNFARMAQTPIPAEHELKLMKLALRIATSDPDTEMFIPTEVMLAHKLLDIWLDQQLEERPIPIAPAMEFLDEIVKNAQRESTTTRSGPFSRFPEIFPAVFQSTKRQRANTAGESRAGPSGEDDRSTRVFDDESPSPQLSWHSASGGEEDTVEHLYSPPGYRPNTQVTERPPPPPDFDHLKCRCKTYAKKGPCTGTCACRKWGSICTSACGCGALCANPFTQLQELFGESELSIRPSACFITWLPSNRIGAVALADYILARYTQGETLVEHELDRVQERWKTQSTESGNPEQKVALAQEINRLGLSEDSTYWFSFCRGSWVSTFSASHCPECKECMESREWHCGKCNKCRYGFGVPCEGCGGVSETYKTVHNIPFDN